MSTPVDMDSVMKRLVDLALNSGGRRGEDEIDNEPAIRLHEDARKLRTALAKLVEAARNPAIRYTDSAATPRRARNKALRELDAALAAVGEGA